MQLHHTMAMDQLLVLLVSFVYVVHACGPDPRHDQSVYCNSQYVFTGILTQFDKSAEESTYRMFVTSNLKGHITSSLRQNVNVYSFGYMYSCAPPSATLNQEYLIYANEDPWTNQPRIKALHSVDQTKRLRNYDCYCKIDLKLPRSAPVINNVPKNSKCELTGVTDTCAVRNGYCGRDWSRLGQGACKWLTSTCS
nr:uncharacterized protein LOC105335683 [Crassostrea gigas]